MIYGAPCSGIMVGLSLCLYGLDVNVAYKRLTLGGIIHLSVRLSIQATQNERSYNLSSLSDISRLDNFCALFNAMLT
jgi:hypothetical protein